MAALLILSFDTVLARAVIIAVGGCRISDSLRQGAARVSAFACMHSELRVNSIQSKDEFTYSRLTNWCDRGFPASSVGRFGIAAPHRCPPR